MSRFFIKVFVPGPFFEPLTYSSDKPIEAGLRVKAPLGSREIVGISAGEASEPQDLSTIKSILEVLDDAPVILSLIHI